MLLLANNPNPSFVSDLILILYYKLFKFGRFQEREFKLRYRSTDIYPTFSEREMFIDSGYNSRFYN